MKEPYLPAHARIHISIRPGMKVRWAKGKGEAVYRSYKHFSTSSKVHCSRYTYDKWQRIVVWWRFPSRRSCSSTFFQYCDQVSYNLANEIGCTTMLKQDKWTSFPHWKLFFPAVARQGRGVYWVQIVSLHRHLPPSIVKLPQRQVRKGLASGTILRLCSLTVELHLFSLARFARIFICSSLQAAWFDVTHGFYLLPHMLVAVPRSAIPWLMIPKRNYSELTT